MTDAETIERLEKELAEAKSDAKRIADDVLVTLAGSGISTLLKRAKIWIGDCRPGDHIGASQQESASLYKDIIAALAATPSGEGEAPVSMQGDLHGLSYVPFKRNPIISQQPTTDTVCPCIGARRGDLCDPCWHSRPQHSSSCTDCFGKIQVEESTDVIQD